MGHSVLKNSYKLTNIHNNLSSIPAYPSVIIGSIMKIIPFSGYCLMSFGPICNVFGELDPNLLTLISVSW